MASLTPIPSVSTASSETPCQSPRAATDANTIPGLTVAASVAVTSGDSAAPPPPGDDDNAVTPGVRSDEASEIAAVPLLLLVWEWCLVARLSRRRLARSFRVIFGLAFVDDADHASVGVAPVAVPVVVVANPSDMVEPESVPPLLLGGPVCCP